MEVLYPRCAGLDVHKATVMAGVRIAEAGQIRSDIRQFATTTPGLLTLSDWLTGHGVTHVAMEATGVYWKPVWHLLDGAFELVLANAAHIRNVPGRKSDVTDAAWIADLLAHGLIRASFVPPVAVQALRDLTRTRKQLVREVAQHTQRIEKTLEDCNLKLGAVISSIIGVSGRAILDAIIAGETDPDALAARADGRLRCSREALVEALRGQVTAHHRFLLRQHLQLVDTLQASIAAFEAQIGTALEPFRQAAERLATIPGVSTIAAQVIVAEVGIDMTRFPTVRHLISWAGLCPRLDESAGKTRSRRVRKGAPWLKTAPLTAMARTADLALLTPSTSLAHTETAMEVLRAGKRCLTFPVPAGPRRATEILAQQGIYDLDKILEVKDLSVRVARILDVGTDVHITSPKGSSLRVQIDGRKTHYWYGIAELEVHMYGSWPPGDSHIAAVENSAEGIAVIDGFISGMGIPSEPLTLRFEKGQLTDIQGNPIDVKKLERLISLSRGEARTFCEVGIGTSPYQRIMNSNGDKYATGTFHLAIGANATPCFGGVHYDGKAESDLHADMVMLAPVEVRVGGRPLVGQGKLLV